MSFRWSTHNYEKGFSYKLWNISSSRQWEVAGRIATREVAGLNYGPPLEIGIFIAEITGPCNAHWAPVYTMHCMSQISLAWTHNGLDAMHLNGPTLSLNLVPDPGPPHTHQWNNLLKKLPTPTRSFFLRCWLKMKCERLLKTLSTYKSCQCFRFLLQEN
jgi:hypothetical protein